MTTPDPWDDDRLATAFAARAAMAAPVPADLATDTSVALRRRRRTRSDAPWWRPLPVAAAAALVVSIVGLSLAMSWRSGSPPAPTGPSAPVASGAAPSDAGTSLVLGLPVIDVPAALAVRDAGEDDRELAVRGWYSPIASRVPCPAMYVKKDSPVQAGCPDQWVVLMAEPASLSATRAAIGQWPVGDGFEVDFDGIDTSVLPSMPRVGSAEPAEIVVVGHFDDRRSRLCPPDVEQACRDRFVVDRVESVDSERVAMSHVVMVDVATPRSTLAEVQSLLADVDPDALVLSVVTADDANVATIEPTLAVDPSELPDSFVVPTRNMWVIRTMETGRPKTFVVTDDTDDVWVMDIDGNLFRFGRRTATPPPLATQAPPTPVETPSQGHATILRLPSASGSALTIGVEDQDSLVRDVRLASEDEHRRFGGGTSLEGVRLVKIAGDDTFYVGWVGSWCDAAFRLVVGGTDDTITSLDLYGQRVRCDGSTVERSVILRAKRPTDSTGIITTDHVVTREFPVSAFELPVMDVEGAQDIRQLADDAHEIAVGGWLSLSPGISCGAPSEEPASRLQPRCGDALNWLLERPEILTFRDGPTVAINEPSGPGVHLRFEAPQVDWPPVDDEGTVIPMPIVAVGHFDDHGADTCPPEDEVWCHDLFIIDSIAWAHGHDLGFAARVSDPNVKSTPDDIVQAIGAIDPTARIVAAWTTPGPGLAESEIGLANLPKAVRTASRVWIVKVIEAGQMRPYLVVDDELAVHRVLDDGTIKRIFGA